MPIRIEELDWGALDGKTLNITVQVLGDKAYVVEGQTVRVADLSAGPVAEELPFFGPRSVRTGALTDEQKRALDVLIKEGYTAHRAAMLLGIHDSTVAHRKKQLREGRELPAPARHRSHVPQRAITPDEIERIKTLRFDQGWTYLAIGNEIGRTPSIVGYYCKKIEEGEYGGHPLALHPTVIEHEPVTNGTRAS